MERSLHLRAILLGGIIAGVLSAIPGLGVLVNCCCCGGFWTLGAVIASYYLVARTRVYPRDTDGVTVGVGSGILSGTLGGLANAVTQLVADQEEALKNMEQLFSFLPSEFQEFFRQSLEQAAQQPQAAAIIFSFIFMVGLAAGISALAGFIALRLLRPLRMMPPLTPPPAWGGWYAPPSPPVSSPPVSQPHPSEHAGAVSPPAGASPPGFYTAPPAAGVKRDEREPFPSPGPLPWGPASPEKSENEKE